MGLEVQGREKRGRPKTREEGIGRRAVGLEVQGRKKRGRPKTT